MNKRTLKIQMKDGKFKITTEGNNTLNAEEIIKLIELELVIYKRAREIHKESGIIGTPYKEEVTLLESLLLRIKGGDDTHAKL